jgi:hypothetical protein
MTEDCGYPSAHEDAIFALKSVSLSDSGLKRFDRDVLSQPGVTHTIVMLGTNEHRASASAVYASRERPSFRIMPARLS